MRRIALLATLASLLLAAIAMAAPTHDGTFDVTGQPEQITAGPDGNVWFVITDSSAANKFGRIQPDGTIDEFNTPAGSVVKDITAAPDGKLWMSKDGGVVEWDPVGLTGDEHDIATIVGARGIAADADGDLWVVRTEGLTEVDFTDGSKIQDVEVPGSSGREIARGSDGRMWWTDFNNAVIHATGTGPAPTTDDYPTGTGSMDVVAGPGNQLAYTGPQNQPYEVGRVGTDGEVTATVLGDVEPFGITFALDEAYWFAQPGADSLGRLTPDGGYTSPVEFDPGSDPRWVAAGPGGTLWVSLKQAEKIARVTGLEAPAPTPTPTPTPTPGGPGGPGGGDTVAPVIADLAVTPRRSRRARRKRTVSFSLSEEAVLALRVERSRKGRRRGKKCVAPKRGTGKRCRRWVRVASVERGAGAGPGTIVVERRLARGRYRIRAIARDAAQNASEPATARFRVRG